MTARSMTFPRSRILPGPVVALEGFNTRSGQPLRWACLADATHENCATRLEVESALTQGLGFGAVKESDPTLEGLAGSL
jgi:hypothetical protein